MSIQKTSWIMYVLVILPVLLINTGHTASFDCSQAKTAVEKMICTDEGLSRLDEELENTFLKAIPKSPDSDYTRKQQKKWLADRNRCQDKVCVKQEYLQRFEELKRIIDLVPLATTEESHAFKNETEKVLLIRDIVRRQDWVESLPENESVFCETFKKDFIFGRHVKVIEPVLITANVHDPRFSELNNCLQYYRQGKQEPEEGGFWGVEYSGASPPYRYYSLAPDNTLIADTEIIFYPISSSLSSSTKGNGYGWIDLQTCTYKSGSIVGTLRGGLSIDPSDSPLYTLYNFSAIIQYKEDIVVIGISPSPYSTTSVSYRFDMLSFDKKKIPRGCSFNLPETVYMTYPHLVH